MFSWCSAVGREVWYFLRKDQPWNIQYKIFQLKLCDLSMEINLGLTQLSLLYTIVRHQGVITAARLSWKATAKIAAFLFYFFISLPLASLWFLRFTASKIRSSATNFEAHFLHTGLLFELASQSREGDNDLLSVLPQNNKITSLPRCSGLQTTERRQKHRQLSQFISLLASSVMFLRTKTLFLIYVYF